MVIKCNKYSVSQVHIYADQTLNTIVTMLYVYHYNSVKVGISLLFNA